MTDFSQHIKQVYEYYQQIKSDTHVYTSISFILDKIEEDSHLKTLTQLFKTIFEREISYAICGRITRIEKRE